MNRFSRYDLRKQSSMSRLNLALLFAFTERQKWENYALIHCVQAKQQIFWFFNVLRNEVIYVLTGSRLTLSFRWSQLVSPWHTFLCILFCESLRHSFELRQFLGWKNLSLKKFSSLLHPNWCIAFSRISSQEISNQD